MIAAAENDHERDGSLPYCKSKVSMVVSSQQGRHVLPCVLQRSLHELDHSANGYH